MRGETRGAMPTRLNKTMGFYWIKTLHGVELYPTEPWRAQLRKISTNTELVSGQFLNASINTLDAAMVT
ncbi:hypothetical protein LF1_26340 [Rubripirellula obstinata]|uniref:Uncharacterized protein n=1 Tax=Rubripirellula obstinata TaxID=406547 RepID=A0A5B1CJI9_9BACT|nr:hypothetical protein LF1_26340 [Rubripirellula obstinata]